MITLFGATGYTGRLIAHALAREALPFRIAGRSAEKLAALAAELPNHPQWLAADATQPASLPPLFQNTQMLINLAGPFTDLGERVVAQAAMSGVHYMDVTNELGYLFKIRTYSEMARRTGAALVPACGFEVAFVDCAASLIGAELLAERQDEPLDEVNIVYALGGKGASQGTRRSAVRSLATSWVAYRGGDWVGALPGGHVRRFELPASHPGDGPMVRHGLSFPSCETVTIPSHLPVRRVDTWMATTPGARFWAPIAVPIFARLSRSILRPLLLAMASKGGISREKALDTGLRTDSPFTIYASARQGQRTRWMALQGKDPYGLTAEIALYLARKLTGSDQQPADTALTGFLAPSQALGAADFLAYAQAHWGLTMMKGG